MPTKAEMYAQMAEKVAVQLTGSWQEWAGFLTIAARLYKYPFHEQLMIYAQRPDATACAEYDLWNDRMGRYVRRGSKGIALVDDSGDRPRLRYVFDISDTGTREHSRTPWLWQLEERHIGPLSAMLERNYDVSSNDLAQQLADNRYTYRRNTGTNTGRTFSISLTVPFWRSTMSTTSRCNSNPPPPSASPMPSCPAAGWNRSSISAMKISCRSSISTPLRPSGRWARRSAR